MNKTLPRIVITGFMGAGKTSVAFALARWGGWRAVDLDALIVEREGRSIRELIDEDGEASFREVETNVLREALEMNAGEVIALGGGAWTVNRNRLLIKEHNCVTAWLDAPFELCWQRITNCKDVRPLARDREHAQRIYNERRRLYELADLHIKVDKESTVREVARRLNEAWSGMLSDAHSY